MKDVALRSLSPAAKVPDMPKFFTLLASEIASDVPDSIVRTANET